MKKEKKDKHFLHKPVFPGGIKAMRKLIRENLQYPEAARNKKVEGTVHLRYAINYLGEVTEAKVISGLSSGCDEEAVRLVKLFRFEVPKNRKVRVLFHKTIQVHFRLPKRAQPKAEAPDTTRTITYQYIPQKPAAEKAAGKSQGYNYTIEW